MAKTLIELKANPHLLSLIGNEKSDNVLSVAARFLLF